jgi:signal transduction histidine kinase
LTSTLLEKAITTFPSSRLKQDEYIQYHSLMLLVSSLDKVTYVFPLTASLLTMIFWPYTNHLILGIWLVAVYVLSLARNRVHQKITQQKSTTISYNRWLKYMLTLDVSAGVLVGGSSLFLTSLPQELQWLLIVIIIAISMESVAAQSAIKSSFIAFTLPLFSGFILGLIAVGSNIFYILSIFAVLHVFFLHGNFTAMHNHIKTNLTLTFANQQLAQQLEQKNQALVTSNEQVNATSQAKSKFIISMSQELKTPLQGMLRMIESAHNNPHDPEHLNLLSIAQASGVRLLNLLNDLMDVYRLEKGQLKPKIKLFEVRQHFEDIAHLMAINAHVKGLKFFCTIDSKVPATIESDPIRLSQITLNLLANAIKFTVQGQVAVNVTCKRHGEQALLTIAVSDTGKGINQVDMKMIFQPFIQGSTDAKTLGNGLGLAITQELCQLLDGQMSVNSVEGEGSVFSVEIPIKITQESELPLLYVKKKILLVEGESQHLLSIEQQLRFLNLHYESVNNVKEAMAVCAESRNQFSAIIIGHQSSLQKKLLINLCQRLKLVTIELFEFGKDNNSEQLTLNYPVKLAQLKATLAGINHQKVS